MNLNDYDYTLPEELIAQEPAGERDKSRLLVLDAETGTLEHRMFTDLPEYITGSDALIVNNTRVFPARLIGNKTETGGEVEIFLLKRENDTDWDALAKPARRLKPGTRVSFGKGALEAVILDKGEQGHVRVRLVSDMPLGDAIDHVGKTPLPPYIRRSPGKEDRERYQTVYAENRGSVAAPTAGLHFSDAVLDTIRTKGATVAGVTLHVGIGTFRPLNDEDAAKDTLHSEYCVVPPETVNIALESRKRGGRIIAVGTTTSRSLETAARSGSLEPFEGWTDIFIKHPYQFNAVDCMVTNFHLPRSSLLMMVCAFAGRDNVLNAYNKAVENNYRFYSYGDAMLILGNRTATH